MEEVGEEKKRNPEGKEKKERPRGTQGENNVVFFCFFALWRIEEFSGSGFCEGLDPVFRTWSDPDPVVKSSFKPI